MATGLKFRAWRVDAAGMQPFILRPFDTAQDRLAPDERAQRAHHIPFVVSPSNHELLARPFTLRPFDTAQDRLAQGERARGKGWKNRFGSLRLRALRAPI